MNNFLCIRHVFPFARCSRCNIHYRRKHRIAHDNVVPHRMQAKWEIYKTIIDAVADGVKEGATKAYGQVTAKKKRGRYRSSLKLLVNAKSAKRGDNKKELEFGSSHRNGVWQRLAYLFEEWQEIHLVFNEEWIARCLCGCVGEPCTVFTIPRTHTHSPDGDMFIFHEKRYIWCGAFDDASDVLST